MQNQEAAEREQQAGTIKNDSMNLTPNEHTMLEFFQSDYFQSRFQKKNTTGEINPDILASVRGILQPLKNVDAIGTVTPDTLGLYKVTTAQDRQVGGEHYASMAIQPWQVMRAVMTREEYTAYHIGTVMAYLMRHKAKGGEQDIKKAQHHLTELVEYLNEKAPS